MSNYNDFRVEVEDIKNNVKSIKSENLSLAMQIVKDYKKQRNMFFTIAVIVVVLYAITIGYLVYTLNDIETIETYETTENYTQDIDDTGDINSSNIINGGSVYGKD